jgi:hypothetical protein
MNTKIYLLAIAILFCVSCKGKKTADIAEIEPMPSAQDSEQDSSEVKLVKVDENYHLNIRYNQRINGYQVNVSFTPRFLDYNFDNIIHGDANIEFVSKTGTKYNVKQGNFFSLVDNFYEVLKTVKKDSGDSGYYGEFEYLPEIPDGKVFYLDYLPNEVSDNPFTLYDFGVPFFFVDANFDGQKELIINDCYEGGQRGCDVFEIISFTNKKLTARFKAFNHNDKIGGIYDNLDSSTRFDKKRKEIILYLSCGVCCDSYEIYKFNEKGEIYLSAKKEYKEPDNPVEGHCKAITTTYHYQWENEKWVVMNTTVVKSNELVYTF